MQDYKSEELSEAHRALLSTLHKCEKCYLVRSLMLFRTGCVPCVEGMLVRKLLQVCHYQI